MYTQIGNPIDKLFDVLGRWLSVVAFGARFGQNRSARSGKYTRCRRTTVSTVDIYIPFSVSTAVLTICWSMWTTMIAIQIFPSMRERDLELYRYMINIAHFPVFRTTVYILPSNPP